MIANRAILASVHLCKLSATSIDEGITSKVLHDNQANGRSGKWSTNLFPNGALDPIKKMDGQIRNYFYEKTLAWGDSNGLRLLPQSLFMAFSEQMTEFKDARTDIVDQFMTDYADHIAAAQRINGSLFRSGSYPAPAVARSKFVFDIGNEPIADSNDFRVNASKEEVDQMKASLERKMARALKSAERDLAERIAGPLAKMVQKLKEKPKGNKKSPMFKDSLITNIREITTEIPDFNVTDNPAFAALHEAMSKSGSVGMLTPAAVRKSPELQEIAIAQGESFLNQLNEVFG